MIDRLWPHRNIILWAQERRLSAAKLAGMKDDPADLPGGYLTVISSYRLGIFRALRGDHTRPFVTTYRALGTPPGLRSVNVLFPI